MMMLDQFLDGLMMLLDWGPIAMLAAGVLVGIAVGSLPGLTSTMAIAILLPLSFQLPPLLSIPLLIGIYKGGLYGGAIPAILIATPGTGGAIATVYDGYPLGQKGYPRKAIQTSLYASAAGDAFSDFMLLFFIAPLAIVAGVFGSPEYLALFLLSLVVIATMTGGSIIKGLFSGFLGILVSLVGIDSVSGSTRFTFGSMDLAAGLSFVPMMIGLFAVSEVLESFQQSLKSGGQQVLGGLGKTRSDDRLTWSEAWRLRHVILQSSVVGTFIGIIPGLGAPIAAFLAYALARKTSSEPEKFGKGSLEGIAAPEAANNAVNGANFIPLFAFGIPGDVIAAIMLGAFVVHGLRPGPDLMVNHGATMYALIICMIIGNAVLFGLGWFLSGLFAQVTRIPKHLLLPTVLAIACVGSYSVNNNIFDVYVMIIFGFLGLLLKKLDVSVVPFVITVILGREIENSLIRTLIVLEGQPSSLINHPVASFLLLATVVALASAIFSRVKSRKPKHQTEGGML